MKLNLMLSSRSRRILLPKIVPLFIAIVTKSQLVLGQFVNTGVTPFLLRYIVDKEDRDETKLSMKILPRTFRSPLTFITYDKDPNYDACKGQHCIKVDNEYCVYGQDPVHKPQTKPHTLHASCVCRACQFDVHIDPETTIQYCHCPSCRKNTQGSFSANIAVAAEERERFVKQKAEKRMPIAVVTRGRRCKTTSAARKSGKDTTIEKWHCEECFSPMATVERDKATGSVVNVDVPMGVIEDKSIEPELALWWQTMDGQNHHLYNPGCDDKGGCDGCQGCDGSQTQQHHNDSSYFWPTADKGLFNVSDLADLQKLKSLDPMVITGGCGCGKVQYAAAMTHIDIQHCYCRLCRQLSGTAYQTWFPVHQFLFLKGEETVKRVRTTPHSQRHFCGACGGSLTIQYDSQPDTIWIAGGGFDQESLPETLTELRKRIMRIAHICCT